MNLKMVFREFKYQIADKVFKRELDETHKRAFIAGVEYAVRNISFDSEIQIDKIQLTKVERKGYEKCQQVIQDTRKRIVGKAQRMPL
jgi:hypothetical protein